MVRVNTVQVTDTGTDSTDLMEYEDFEHVRHITTEDRYRVSCAKTEVRTDTELEIQKQQDLESCLREAKRVIEDSNSTETERQEAVRRMELKVDEADRYRRFLTAQKRDIDNCKAIQTRSKQRELEQKSTEKTVENQTEQKTEENIYEDYDKEFQATERSRRRVRFEDFIQSSGERKMITEHIQVENRVRQPKGQNASQNEKQKERSAKAIAEAERRGATRADLEDKLAQEIQEQQHDLFKEKPQVVTKENIQVYKENDFSAGAAIKDVSDFTLATYLMENKVSL
jgi:hypothetical protein